MDAPENNPQKNCIKKACSVLYYGGLGNCWYEEKTQTRLQRRLYQFWIFLSNFYTLSFTVNEFLAHFRSDLDDKEKNDVVQFMLAHSSIIAKILCTCLAKQRIKKVLERLIEGTRSVFVVEELDRACVKQAVRLCVAVVGVSYMTLFIATVDGIRAHFIEGVPIRTEVTFYPTSSDTGTLVNILRLFIQFHWWFLVSIMVGVDSLCICSLVFVGYKFKVVQVYFHSLREKVLNNVGKKSREALEQEFKKDFIVGIQMHEEALWCAKNVQHAFGNLYSVQVLETVVLLVMCLIKLVTVDRNFIFLVANFAFMACLILLTGAYMLPAGDITHEASLVSMAMFHSGWEAASAGRELRVIAVLALQRSQVRVCMFAFGIIALSYTNFISVIRSSYSFFAVMY